MMPPSIAASPVGIRCRSFCEQGARLKLAPGTRSEGRGPSYPLYFAQMLLIRLIFLAAAILASSAVQAQETRIALVIGNSDYSSGPLPNPANDAKLVGDALTALGFDVIARRNADQVTMKRAIQEFGSRLEKAGPAAVGLFYYAGHGMQLSGRNYLIPTTARIEREGDVEIEAVSADWVIEQMKYARNRLNIVILDACRNNPLSGGQRSMTRGLALVNAPHGSLVAFSTAPGGVSVDGDGQNSPYTQALARAMVQRGFAAEQVFREVRVKVLEATGRQQVPWESSSLTGAFYFSPALSVAGGGSSVTARETQSAPRDITVAAKVEPREPGMTPPARQPTKQELIGRWEGRYQCQHEDLGFSLNITLAETGRISAVFDFFPLPGTPSFPRGSFRMVGDYDRVTSSLQLEGTEWIKRPLGFQKHDIEGQLAENGASISGRILTTGCSQFVLTRR